jgi:MFS family permease
LSRQPSETVVTSPAAESSLRYAGWRVVAACFLVEMFIFGFGLYGHAVYLAELQRLHGWPTTLISTASTLSFLLGSLLAAFTNDALAWLGPRRLVLLGITALAASTTLLAFTTTPLQLYAAYVLMSFGWAGMGTVVAATILRSWFDRRSGLAISLAFNGATCGGIIVAPALVVLVGAIGFTRAMLVATLVLVVVLVPVVTSLIGLPVAARGSRELQTDAVPSGLSRRSLLCSFRFWSITAPFALALLAQVGFIVHQIALLEPAMGRSPAGLAVAATTAMAVVGRLCLGLVVDRLDPRLASALSLVTQAGALFTIAQTTDVTSLFAACAIYGFSIGNLITLPPLIIQREYDQAAFGRVLGLSTALGGVVSAFGPGVVGLVREATGGYAAALVLCLALKLVAAAIVLLRPQRATG